MNNSYDMDSVAVADDIYDILGIDEASLDESARGIVSHHGSKWVTYHGEGLVREKRTFFQKHLAVLGVDFSLIT